MHIVAVNLEIGLGHPNYLDYVIQTLQHQALKINIKYLDVVNYGPVQSQLFWQISKRVYCIGARGGFYTHIYNKIRSLDIGSGYNIYRQLSIDADIILVSHPLLAQNLRGRVWYIHGEIAVPKECAVYNVEKIIVPLNQTKERLIALGVKPENLLVTGLLISSELTNNAEEVFNKRLLRIKSANPLTIGFFISGAYPKPHIEKIIAGISSAIKENNRVIVFIGIDRKKAKDFLKQLNRIQIKGDRPKTPILFIQGKNRLDYEKRINRFLPLLDIFVAASHEHTNWAVGLGLPMFAPFPMIGSYAEENFQFAQKQEVVFPLQTIADAKNLGKTVSELRGSGILLKMVENGFGKFSIDGATKSAQAIINK